jgi:2-oxoglutarate ferredoxin oxidoreductase subunit beta
MTGGQFSPLTPTGKRATTAPYGSIDRAFNLVELSRGAGATYVARGDVFHAVQLTNLIVEAAQHKGFSVVEAVSTCPVSFGRYNDLPQPADMMLWLRDNTVTVQQAAKMNEEDLVNKIIIGKHFETEAVEYCEEMARLLERAGE